MNKRDYINLLYLLVLEDQKTARLSQGYQRALIVPYLEQGNRYQMGVRVLYHDGIETFRRNFYFEDTMQEEFYRYINRKFLKAIIQSEVEDLYNNGENREAA